MSHAGLRVRADNNTATIMFSAGPVQYRVRVRCREAPCPASRRLCASAVLFISGRDGWLITILDCIVAAYPRHCKGGEQPRKPR